MSDSLIARLPKIAAAGKKEAETIMERAKSCPSVSLQADECVYPLISGGATATEKEVSTGEWRNRLFYGDNLGLMEALLAGDPLTDLPPLGGKIDLIYIDPPFASRSGYRAVFTVPGAGGEPLALEQQAYQDTWDDGLCGYLRMLSPRLYLIKALLSERGSLIVHMDWHAVHYVKVLLDEIFGCKSFRNEIAWCYGGGGAAKRTYPRKHDQLLWYTKGNEWTFHKQFRPYTKGTLERGLTAAKGGRYALNKEGAGLDDWWAGGEVQKILSPTAFENLKFNTQKPEGLLRRIIRGHSREGDLVADFFCGTGTTGAVAERLGRRWIMIDAGKLAFMIAFKRLLAQQCKPFFNQSANDAVSPAYGRLAVKKSVSRGSAGMEELTVELFDYQPPCGERLSVPAGAREQIQKLIASDPLALLEYWMIDPDYDGRIFRSRWQSCRSRRGDGLRVDMKAALLVPRAAGGRRICVKAVDVFGCESREG